MLYAIERIVDSIKTNIVNRSKYTLHTQFNWLNCYNYQLFAIAMTIDCNTKMLKMMIAAEIKLTSKKLKKQQLYDKWQEPQR